ncbi:MAG: ATP-binding cassette domain-containing protein [Dehalococcoidia bacterium]
MTLRAERLGHIYLAKTPLQRVALVDVSLTVSAGECLAIVGASGSGKSTLAGILAGLVPPTAGKLYLDAEEITAAPITGGWGKRYRSVAGWAKRASRAGLRGLAHPQHWTVHRGPAPRPTRHDPPARPVMLAFQNPEDQFFTTRSSPRRCRLPRRRAAGSSA